MGESLRIGQRSSWKPGQLGEGKISVIFLEANLKLIGPFYGTLELGRAYEIYKKLRGPLCQISVIFLAANLKLIGPFHGTLELGQENEIYKKLRGPLSARKSLGYKF